MDGGLDRFFVRPELSLALSYDPASDFRAFAELELAQEISHKNTGGWSSGSTELQVVQLYLTKEEILPNTTLQLGRQEFEDEIEWWYQEELDAVRGYYQGDNFSLEASASLQGLLHKDLANGGTEDRINNYFLVGHMPLGEESVVSGYLLARDGLHEPSEDLYFLGLQSIGELSDEVDYWVNAAYVTGRSKNSDGRTDVSGFGLDLVATYAPDLRWEPSLTLGFAFGSGESGATEGSDGSFRQTGLQDNSAEFNGVLRFKYYGEALDPELSNLAIFTAGLGAKPSEESSVDLVYHYYRQHHAADFLRDTEIDADPLGQSADLGHGLDLILGYQEFEDISAEFVLGAFFPGSAFASDAEPTVFAGFEIRYEF